GQAPAVRAAHRVLRRGPGPDRRGGPFARGEHVVPAQRPRGDRRHPRQLPRDVPVRGVRHLAAHARDGRPAALHAARRRAAHGRALRDRRQAVRPPLPLLRAAQPRRHARAELRLARPDGAPLRADDVARAVELLVGGAQPPRADDGRRLTALAPAARDGARRAVARGGGAVGARRRLPRGARRAEERPCGRCRDAMSPRTEERAPEGAAPSPRRLVHVITPGDHFSPRTGSAVPTVVDGLSRHARPDRPRPAVVVAAGTYPDRYDSAEVLEY